jgi:hypothetical protein
MVAPGFLRFRIIWVIREVLGCDLFELIAIFNIYIRRC